jgi:hypothetical protein
VPHEASERAITSSTNHVGVRVSHCGSFGFGYGVEADWTGYNMQSGIHAVATTADHRAGTAGAITARSTRSLYFAADLRRLLRFWRRRPPDIQSCLGESIVV